MSASNRVWLAVYICVVAFAGIAILTIAFSTREREHLTANAPNGDVPASSLTKASTTNEALENARRTALSLLPTLTEYRVEETLVKHCDSNAANAERALEQSNDILHRGGKKPRILDVLREPDEAFLDLELPPDEAAAHELQQSREDIESATSLIRERRKDIEHQEALLTKAKDGIEAERKELEASFKKFSAMSEQQKQQQRDRLESRARNATGLINNAIASIEQDVSRLERELAELKHKEPDLAAAVAESVKRNTDIYFREINKVGPLLYAAGLPNERGAYEFKRKNLYARLSNGLHTAATQMKEVVERNAPQHSSSDGLEYLADITHIVEGDQYYMSNRVVTIPDEYEPLYVSDRAGPNQVVVNGEFRFVGNSTGKNRFGASINVELYECDPKYSESLKRLREYERETRPFVDHFEPLARSRQSRDSIEHLIDVLKNLLGEEKVAAALGEGDRKFEQALESRDPFTPIDWPTISNELAVSSANADPGRVASPEDAKMNGPSSDETQPRVPPRSTDPKVPIDRDSGNTGEAFAETPVTLERQNEQVAVKIRDAPFAVYNVSKELPKPFFAPVRGPNGTVISRPLENPEDHKHHKGIWVSIDEVNGIKFWAEAGKIENVSVKLHHSEGKGPAKLEVVNHWLGEDRTPVVIESTTIGIFPNRLMTYDIVFTTADAPVTFGDTKEGLLGFRMINSMREKEGGKVVNADGKQGTKKCWGQPSAWVDCYGEAEGKIVGVTLMDHPGNFRPLSVSRSRLWTIFGQSIRRKSLQPRSQRC